MQDQITKNTIDKVREVLRKTLPRLMQGMLDKMDDALFDYSDRAETEKQHTAYMDAMRNLRKGRKTLQQQFEHKCLEAYTKFWSQSGEKTGKQKDDDAPKIDLSGEGFSLIDDADLEENLAVTVMISKAESSYEGALFSIEQRFEALGAKDISNINNPIAPKTLADAFEDSLEAVELDLDLKIVLYKLFDKEVLGFIGGMYDEINHLLGKQGVLPNLAARGRRNPVSPAVQRARSREAAEAGDDDSQLAYEEESSYVQAEIFNTLQQLMQVRRPAGTQIPRYGPSGAPLPAVASSELLNALSQIQHSAPMPVVGGDSQLITEQPDVKNALMSELQINRTAATRTIGEAEDDTIDVIAMLFEFILEDRNLSDSMKALISRLQIPMLKVAILDKTFFSQKAHPARRLLNNLAQAAIGWVETEDRGKDTLYGQIERIVGRILTEFGNDPDLFAELNEDFD
ncbi:MAG: DUF1631 domain-containing protein, partial [gamma proteobacterium symbiont of Bathyaustriella thionipta]|nr:DUF1631 domain-containing protein [gamma proteobacterium symbiont of Bathyaustriella thionipta]